MIVPPGPEIVAANFSISADILDWKTSGTNWSGLGLVGKGVKFPGGDVSAVGGGLILNSEGIPGRVRPYMGDGDYGTNGLYFRIEEFPPPYHLECSGVGSTFSLRVFSLTTKKLIREMSMVRSVIRDGFMALWFNAPGGVAASHEITVDNYLATGTKP